MRDPVHMSVCPGDIILVIKSLNLISLEFECVPVFKKGFLKQDNIRQNFHRIQKGSEFTGSWTDALAVPLNNVYGIIHVGLHVGLGRFWWRTAVFLGRSPRTSQNSFGDDGKNLVKLIHAPSVVLQIYLLCIIFNELSCEACGMCIVISSGFA